MQFELYIDGEKKTFTAPFVPMLARRKYLELEAAVEKKIKENENYTPSRQEELEEETEMISILCDVVFQGQFTVDQVFNGAEFEYVFSKLQEAVWGKKTTKKDDEGNDLGE